MQMMSTDSFVSIASLMIACIAFGITLGNLHTKK